MKTLGTILVAVGILMVAITGFTFITHKNVVDLGPIQVNKEVSHPVAWSPIIGGVLLAGGIVVLVTSSKK
jgi:hypothetical protein